MISYISSEKDVRKQNSLNTCIKSLENMVYQHKWQETNQPYTEISYFGSLSELDPTIKYPRKVLSRPVIAYIECWPYIIGTTDGVSFSKNMVSELPPKVSVIKEATDEVVESQGEDRTEETETLETVKDVEIKINISKQYHYYSVEIPDPDDEEETITEWHEQIITTTTQTNTYKNPKVSICMRF